MRTVRTTLLSLAALIGFALLCVWVVVLSGCSSKQGTSEDTADGGGLAAPGNSDGLQGHDTNPAGIPYPTANIGRRARGLNSKNLPNTAPGDVIANDKFLGYPAGDQSKGLQVVALADYFDPQGAKYKVIHLIAAATWCPDCSDETDTLVKACNTPSTDPRNDGVVYVQALIEGASPNYGATENDLDMFIDEHKTPWTSVLDPEARVLGVFFDADAVPWNADIDARSMEILQAGVGFEDPTAVSVWVDWVNKNPPAYP